MKFHFFLGACGSREDPSNWEDVDLAKETLVEGSNSTYYCVSCKVDVPKNRPAIYEHIFSPSHQLKTHKMLKKSIAFSLPIMDAGQSRIQIPNWYYQVVHSRSRLKWFFYQAAVRGNLPRMSAVWPRLCAVLSCRALPSPSDLLWNGAGSRAVVGLLGLPRH